MSDRPDYTLPVSIEAVTISTLPISIDAITITSLPMNITAQDLTDIRIEFHAQTMAVKLVPDWGAIQAQDIDMCSYATCASGVSTVLILYTVPAGKKLLLYDWSISMYDGDGGVWGRLYTVTAGVVLGVGGGTRGFQTPFSKPKRIDSGETLQVMARQDTGATRSIWGHIGGTLI